jgi:threonine/homoserine/homoserine lactone efflux protein
MFGIGVGFVVMLVLVGVGLVRVFDAWPASHLLLKAVGAVYLVYLAWKIARAGRPVPDQSNDRPLTFTQAALFQWVNPKAWAMAVTAVTVYAPSKSFDAILVVAAIFGVINLPSVSCWAMLGRQIRPLLGKHRHLRAFNISMAVLLLVTVLPVFWPTSSA